MITTIDLQNVPASDRGAMLDLYRVALAREDARMTMREAAWMYGYTYQTVRIYVADGMIRTCGRGHRRRITHAAMRAYIRGKKLPGAPRKGLKALQTKLA